MIMIATMHELASLLLTYDARRAHCPPAGARLPSCGRVLGLRGISAAEIRGAGKNAVGPLLGERRRGGDGPRAKPQEQGGWVVEDAGKEGMARW
jgi:hypothetical protein